MTLIDKAEALAKCRAIAEEAKQYGMPQMAMGAFACAEAIAALAPTDAAQAREAAARLLLDMLHMRNGAHEGVSKEDAQKMWDAASTREGYAAVDAFLRSIIGEARK